jgi:preprotein translocase subunit SecE
MSWGIPIPLSLRVIICIFRSCQNGGSLEILDRIGHHVKAFKESPSSVFQQFHDKWLCLSQTVWTTKRITILSSILIFITTAFMSVRRYRSIVKINTELIQNVAERMECYYDYFSNNSQGLRKMTNTDNTIMNGIDFF